MPLKILYSSVINQMIPIGQHVIIGFFLLSKTINEIRKFIL